MEMTIKLTRIEDDGITEKSVMTEEFDHELLSKGKCDYCTRRERLLIPVEVDDEIGTIFLCIDCYEQLHNKEVLIKFNGKERK